MIRVNVLVENTSSLNSDLAYEHGLSLLIESRQNKLLFDLGASDLFLTNARKLGLKLREASEVIISHGHYDHGGGLEKYLEVYPKARVYLNKNAFGKYFAKRSNGKYDYIGLSSELYPDSRFIFVGEEYQMDENKILFSGVAGKKYFSPANNSLFVKREEKWINDDFLHEQNLIIRDGKTILLVAGCAHRGIINILDYAKAIYGIEPTHVIGGFHLKNLDFEKVDNRRYIDELGSQLKQRKTIYYTGHCTGDEAYKYLKRILKDQLQMLTTGLQIDI